MAFCLDGDGCRIFWPMPQLKWDFLLCFGRSQVKMNFISKILCATAGEGKGSSSGQQVLRIHVIAPNKSFPSDALRAQPSAVSSSHGFLFAPTLAYNISETQANQPRQRKGATWQTRNISPFSSKG